MIDFIEGHEHHRVEMVGLVGYDDQVLTAAAAGALDKRIRGLTLTASNWQDSQPTQTPVYVGGGMTDELRLPLTCYAPRSLMLQLGGVCGEKIEGCLRALYHQVGEAQQFNCCVPNEDIDSQQAEFFHAALG